MQTGIAGPFPTYAPHIFGALHDAWDAGMGPSNGTKWWNDSLLIVTVATTRQAKLISEIASETRRADAQDDNVHSPEKLAAPVQEGESNKRDK